MIQRNLKRNVSERQMNKEGKVTRSSTLLGYQVTGWRYLKDASWHVKVWIAGHPGDWMGYTVTAGKFELQTGTEAHKEAALQAIREWEAEVPILQDLP
jgi:hypothetical protein